MRDLLATCHEGEFRNYNPRDFDQTFCKHCRNDGCSRAKWAEDAFSARISTQEERFFNAPPSNLALPKFAQIAGMDFRNMLQEAMRLEIADRRGDWEVPEIPVLDGRSRVAEPQTTSAVDEAIRQLSTSKGTNAPGLPPAPPAQVAHLEVQEDEPLPEPELPPEPAAPPEPAPPPPQPSGPPPLIQPGNTEAPEDGIMIGGGPRPDSGAVPAHEDWGPPKETEIIVPVGATVRMGGRDKR